MVNMVHIDFIIPNLFWSLGAGILLEFVDDFVGDVRLLRVGKEQVVGDGHDDTHAFGSSHASGGCDRLCQLRLCHRCDQSITPEGRRGKEGLPLAKGEPDEEPAVLKSVECVTCLVATEGFDPAGPVIENRTGLAAARAVDDLIDGDPPIWSHAQCGKDAGKNADVAISHLPMDAFPNKIPRQSHLSIRSKLFFKSPKSFLGRRQLRAESFSRTKIDVEHGCRRNRASIRFTISIPSVLPLRPLGRRIPDLVGACDRSD